ncbi:Lactate utilization protein B [compost metagenome]
MDEQVGMKGFQYVMANYKIFAAAVKFAQFGQKLLVRDGAIKSKLGPLKGWNTYRHIPALPSSSFRDSWKDLDMDLQSELKEMQPERLQRMKQIIEDRKNHPGGAH